METVLGGIFGGALGGILTVSLLFSGTGHWVIWIPIIAGALVGLWKGDRALRGLIRMLEIFS